MNRLHNDH